MPPEISSLLNRIGSVSVIMPQPDSRCGTFPRGQSPHWVGGGNRAVALECQLSPNKPTMRQVKSTDSPTPMPTAAVLPTNVVRGIRVSPPRLLASGTFELRASPLGSALGRHADQRTSEASPTGSHDGGSSLAPSGAACGARISNGRLRCCGDAVVKLRPAARTARRRAAAAIK